MNPCSYEEFEPRPSLDAAVRQRRYHQTMELLGKRQVKSDARLLSKSEHDLKTYLVIPRSPGYGPTFIYIHNKYYKLTSYAKKSDF